MWILHHFANHSGKVSRYFETFHSSNLRSNEENIKKAIVLIWTFSIVVGFPGFLLNVWSNEKTYYDVPFGSELNLARKIYLITYSIFSMYIPIVVFLFCYGSLIKRLYFSNEIFAESTNEDTSEKKKLLMTFILATSGFPLGYPSHCFPYHEFFRQKDRSVPIWNTKRGAFFFLFLIRLCLNPVLYAFFTKQKSKKNL